MEKSDFVVTLPSNSNMITHPTNRGHNYVVKMATPINLTSRMLNNDARWEVALTTLQYTNHFYQLREDVIIHAVVIVPDLKSIQINSPSGKPIQLDVDFTEDMAGIRALSMAQRRILRPFVKNDTNKDESWFVILGKFVVPAGEYKTSMELARRIAKEFSAVFNIPRYQYRMQAERIDPGGRLRFTAESRLDTPRKRRTSEPASPGPGGIVVDYDGHSRPGKYNFFLYTEHISISSPLGQVLIPIDEEAPPIYYISPISTITPSFNSVKSLYVYSDIVDYQRVGDGSAQLMDIAPVQGAPCQRQHYVFDPPTYLPVNRNFMDTIKITIRDDSDNEALFPDDVQNVVCRLHFRRATGRI
jgi:hypothetical protein